MINNTKISVKIGGVEFSGEGTETWLEKQLDKVLKQVGTVPAISIGNTHEKHSSSQNKPISLTLASFLGEKNARTNQVRKFLAAAAFLQKKGKATLKTSDVTRALQEASQSRLGNPSDTLNQNISKGHCDRSTDGGFYVTTEGFEELGITD